MKVEHQEKLTDLKSQLHRKLCKAGELGEGRRKICGTHLRGRLFDASFDLLLGIGNFAWIHLGRHSDKDVLGLLSAKSQSARLSVSSSWIEGVMKRDSARSIVCSRARSNRSKGGRGLKWRWICDLRMDGVGKFWCSRKVSKLY